MNGAFQRQWMVPGPIKWKANEWPVHWSTLRFSQSTHGNGQSAVWRKTVLIAKGCFFSKCVGGGGKMCWIMDILQSFCTDALDLSDGAVRLMTVLISGRHACHNTDLVPTCLCFFTTQCPALPSSTSTHLHLDAWCFFLTDHSLWTIHYSVTWCQKGRARPTKPHHAWLCCGMTVAEARPPPHHACSASCLLSSGLDGLPIAPLW